MKLFNNIQEMWNHCEKCPTCLKERDIEIFTTSYNRKIFSHSKTENYLSLLYIEHKKNTEDNECSYLKINCLTNAIESEPSLDIIFYFRAKCIFCNESYFNSYDIEYAKGDLKIYNLYAYSDLIVLNGRSITFNYSNNKLYINNYRDNTSIITVDMSKNIDIYDKNLSNKINTIINFS